MTERRHINQAGLEIIKAAEGLRTKPYMDKYDGWTVGYGHLLRPAELKDGKPIKKRYTREECERLLRLDVSIAEAVVHLYVPDHEDLLSDNAFSALVSFAYNIGSGQFRSSTLLRLLNQGDLKGAAEQFLRWVLDDGMKQGGLVKRRAREKALFLKESLEGGSHAGVD